MTSAGRSMGFKVFMGSAVTMPGPLSVDPSRGGIRGEPHRRARVAVPTWPVALVAGGFCRPMASSDPSGRGALEAEDVSLEKEAIEAFGPIGEGVFQPCQTRPLLPLPPL